MSEIKNERLYFLDWLRVLAFALLIIYHAGLMFVDWGYHIQNDELSESLKLPMLFLNHWRLPLLFFISGVGVSFSFKKRTISKYLKERFNRLFIPLIAGILLVVPIQVYYERLHYDQFDGSYFDFYPRFFEGIYPDGNFMWSHLWFLVYLIVFILIALPLFNLIRQNQNSLAIQRLTLFLKRKGALLVLLSLPLIIMRLTLREAWPDNRNLVSDWYNFSVYITFFIYGYFIAQIQTLWLSIKKWRWLHLIVGLTCFILVYFGQHQPGINFLENSTTGGFIFNILTMVNSISMVLSCLGFGMIFLEKNTSYLSYANQAVYPVFVLHQSVLIMTGYYILPLDLSIGVKLLIVSSSALIGSVLINHFLILPFSVTRVMFGVKPIRKNHVSVIQTKPIQYE